MKTQQDEMTNARLAQRSGWVNFTCQKALCNISLAINVSLRIKNGIQHTNYQLNNTYEDTHDKEKDPFCLKSVFFFAIFGDCPYFLNQAQDKLNS